MVDGKKLGGLLGLMAGWSALAPDDAEAAIRPDIEDIIAKAIGKQKWAGRFAGTLESPAVMFVAPCQAVISKVACITFIFCAFF